MPAENHPVDLSLAASDAQHIIRDNQTIQKIVAGLITTRRIQILLNRGIADALEQDYELKHPELTAEYLQSSALDKAATSSITVAETRDELLQLLLPLVDIFVKIEEDYAESKQKAVLGNDDGAAE